MLKKFLPPKLYGHVSTSFGDKILVWGGFGGYEKSLYQRKDEHEDSLENNEEDINFKYNPSQALWIFNTFIGHWELHVVAENCPQSVTGACSLTTADNYMYIFGGFSLESGPVNSIHCLNLDTLKWNDTPLISSKFLNTELPSPRDKCSGWIYNDKLFFFGGFTYSFHQYGYLNLYGDFVEDPDESRGWTNQLVCYDIKSKKWSNPKQYGSIPDPRAAHQTVEVGEKVYLYGGRTKEGRTNTLYSLNKATLTWEGPLNLIGDFPVGRSWHSLKALTPTKLHLFGGLSNDNQPLGDSWIIDLSNMEYIRHPYPMSCPYLWHSAVQMRNGEVFTFGGCQSNLFDISEAPVISRNAQCFNVTPFSLLRLSFTTVISLHLNLLKLETILPRELLLKVKMCLDNGRSQKHSAQLIQVYGIT